MLPSKLLGITILVARRCMPHNRSLYWLASSDPNYLLWLLHHKRPSLDLPPGQPHQREPYFSVLMPVYNTRTDWLSEAIDSVRCQIFDAWELIIVDDASTAVAVPSVLEKWAKTEPRIRILRNDVNCGIAASTNRAARAAKGRYLILLDHDDTLYPDALAVFAQAISREPQARLLYADEDRLTPEGLRELHDFKPAFSPSLLEMCNYILHPLCIRRDLWHSAGGLCSCFDGSQDYDLLLRLVDCGERPVHVAGILYSWRQGASSMAGGAIKPHIFRAGRKALRHHLVRRGEHGDIDDNPETGPGDYRIRFRLPTKLRLLLVTDGSVPALPECWRVDRLPASPNAVSTLRTHDLVGYDAVVWLDAGLIPGDWSGPLNELIGWCRRDDVGVVGGRLLTPSGRVVHAGLSLTQDGRLRADFAGRPLSRTPPASRLRDCVALAPGALAVAGCKLAALLLDDTPLPPAAWSLALCLAAQARGWRVVYTPFACFRTNAVPAIPDTSTSRALLTRHAIVADPYTNPFLASANGNDLRLPLQWSVLDRLVAHVSRRQRDRALGQQS